MSAKTGHAGAAGKSSQQAKQASSTRASYSQDRKALYDRVSRDASSPAINQPPTTLRQNGAQYTSSDKSRAGRSNPAMSFVMLTESQVTPPEIAGHDSQGDSGLEGSEDEGNAMSQQMETSQRLFNILSAKSDIDHPICVECTDLLVDGLQARLEAANRERDAYVSFLKQVNANIPSQEEVIEAKESLKESMVQKSAAEAELERLEREKAQVDDEIANLEEEASLLDIEEEAFWRSRNAFAMKLAEFQNERDSVNQKYDHDSQQLEKLQRTNVYNDTFCISHDGPFGTINGLRLGRRSDISVEWPEINAAWGHTLLLLATVADRFGYKFEGYRLKPMGSTSKIEKLDYPSPAVSGSGSQVKRHEPKVSILELYSSGDMPLGLTFMHRRFDNAMVAFLDCLHQLGDYVNNEYSRSTNSAGHGLKLPYEIKKDKINDISIKLGFNHDEGWTKACKFALTCCKFLLAHASNIDEYDKRSGT